MPSDAIIAAGGVVTGALVQQVLTLAREVRRDRRADVAGVAAANTERLEAVERELAGVREELAGLSGLIAGLLSERLPPRRRGPR